MPIIRRKLDENTVYPTDLRYNPDTETVQSFVNGDWVDNPEADPRTKTTLPPRITSDPACDAAESVKDALKGQIEAVMTAIDNSLTLFTIAGIILSIFSFGVFAIFIDIALGIGGAMVSAGSSAIAAALTDPVYETFKCILFCHINSSGRLRTGELGAVESDVDAQIGGLGATILNAMLSLAGEGGINNLASLGTSTGDCSGCGCACDELNSGTDGGGGGTVVYVGDNVYLLTSVVQFVSGVPHQHCTFSCGGVGFCFSIQSMDTMGNTLRSGSPYQILCDGTDVGDAGINPSRCLQVCDFATVHGDNTAFTIRISICACS